MVYKEYQDAVAAKKLSELEYQKVLSEKESLFQMTQPRSSRVDQEKVTTSNSGTSFDAYLVEKERRRIDERLEEAKAILDARAEVVEVKRLELYESKEPLDVVFRLRWLEGMSPTSISAAIHYSESQVYRFMRRIKESK